jgi:class 3 adenylate cyclase
MLKLIIDAAHRCDGHVVHLTGDGILGPFGHQSRTEHHPRRAVRVQDEVRG